MIFYGEDQFSASEVIIVGEAVEGAEDGVGIAFAVEDVVEVTGKPYLFEFVGHPHVKELQCMMPTFFNLLTDDF